MSRGSPALRASERTTASAALEPPPLPSSPSSSIPLALVPALPPLGPPASASSSPVLPPSTPAAPCRPRLLDRLPVVHPPPSADLAPCRRAARRRARRRQRRLPARREERRGALPLGRDARGGFCCGVELGGGASAGRGRAARAGGRGRGGGCRAPLVLAREERRQDGLERGGACAQAGRRRGRRQGRARRVVPGCGGVRRAGARRRAHLAREDVVAALEVRVHEGERVREALRLGVAVPAGGREGVRQHAQVIERRRVRGRGTHVRSSVVSIDSLRSRSVLPSRDAYQPTGSPSPFLAR